MQKIISRLKNEFELFYSGSKDPSKEFAEKFGKGLKLPKDCIEFLKIHNGMKRLEKDRYFTFQILPVNKMYLLDQMGDMPEEEKLEFLGLEQDDFSGDWTVFASEGEYGVYAINFNEKSPKFGMVYGIIVNIPERFNEWKSFQEFLEGLPDYCSQFPLITYRENKPGSDPWYGISF